MLFISAWNESGGGFLHRIFDGHPQCFVYPFELQLGTDGLHDAFGTWFSPKYRWPWLNDEDLQAQPAALHAMVLDDEVKGYLLDRSSSKFSQFDLELSINAWVDRFAEILAPPPRSTADLVTAYISSLFDCWVNRKSSRREFMYVGHCPTLIVDADRILADLANVQILHVVRSPVAGFRDFRDRVPDMEVEVYCRKWTVVNTLGLTFAKKHPSRVKLVSFIDLVDNKRRTLSEICEWVGLECAEELDAPTWNGALLDRVPPFGGVPEISAQHELGGRAALGSAMEATIGLLTAGTRDLLG